MTDYSGTTIGFALYPERGGYYPSFTLARALKERGHRVIYYITSEFESDMLQQGIEYRILFRNEFGDGAFDARHASEQAGLLYGLKQKISSINHKYNVLLKSVVSGEITEAFHQDHLDLVLVDSMLPSVIVGAQLGKLNVVRLSTGLVCADHSVAPFTSSINCAQDSIFNEIKIKLAWMWFIGRFHIKVNFHKLSSCLLGVEAIDKNVMNSYRKMKDESGLRFSFREYGLIPEITEYMLAPSAIEFKPTREIKKRVYLGHCIDLRRSEPEFPWSKIRSDKPIVLCSLGTHVADYAAASRFFTVILAVARQKPDVTFVLSLGPGRNLSDYGYVPDNVIAQLRIPQLALLQKSAVAITSGGLGTVKECIYFGVPMLVLPCAFDQPSNAAKVAAHLIGLRDDINRVSVTGLSKKLDGLLNDVVFKARILELSHAFRQNSEFSEGIDSLEQMIVRCRTGGLSVDLHLNLTHIGVEF